MKSNLILKIVVAIIFILAIVGFGMVATAGAKESPEMASAANFVVNLSLVLLVVTAGFAIILSIFGLLKNPAALKKTLLGLAVFAILFVIAYFAADNLAVVDANKEQLVEQGSTSKWSGAGLNFSLILLVVGGAMFVFDMLKSLIKS